ncbi:MAG: pyridoxamine 5'-phosphate oxidase family protein [Nitrospira sp.]|nr:pyridoxamine 5'-phosphate oxidase family protein [Candidatus Manganitrophaceae bacterium]HIL34311.1 pyridoxamine 5'-phosphate oxidase family protein [Candidatus Manganitrophaceae bacterium]
MADKFDVLSDEHIVFIKKQHLFFVGTAGSEGFVNVSPKGMDSFRVINRAKVVWLNLTGSGNETAAHVLENRRMTVMFCSFDKQPLILRLFAQAKAIHPRDGDWEDLYSLFPEDVGARQIFELQLILVTTSCGYAVPYFELKEERPTLSQWAESRGKQGILDYWEKHNQRSLNDKETGIF